MTVQERKALLFLLSMVLMGVCINFVAKTYPAIEQVSKIDERCLKVSINQANYEDLLRVQNITPKLAKKIIEFRLAQGSFRSIEELKEIKGIGNDRYEKLKDLFFVE
jgi:competence protein ComEA